jgi:hypothetical protein
MKIQETIFLTHDPAKLIVKDKDPNLKRGYVIMRCLIRAIAQLRGW